MGAPGTYYSGTAKLTAPATLVPERHRHVRVRRTRPQVLGTVKFDALVFPVPADLPDYTTWNVGVGFTWKVFTLDLRYSGSDLSKSNCFIITGDPRATTGGTISTLNGGGRLQLVRRHLHRQAVG